MNLHQYSPLAMRTAKIIPALDMLTHGAMGCMTEAGELAQTALDYATSEKLDIDNFVEELGDGVWFANYTAHAADISLGALLANDARPTGPVRPLGGVLKVSSLAVAALTYCAKAEVVGTHMKAVRYYGKPLSDTVLRNGLRDLMHAILSLCAVVGVEPGAVLAANIAKLQKRYPDQYSDAAALARADKVTEAHVAAIAAPGVDTDNRLFDAAVKIANGVSPWPWPKSGIDVIV